MDGKAVPLSLREFTDRFLSVPHGLISTHFPEGKMAEIQEALADTMENYGRRAWDDERHREPEEQLAAEFVNVSFSSTPCDCSSRCILSFDS